MNLRELLPRRPEIVFFLLQGSAGELEQHSLLSFLPADCGEVLLFASPRLQQLQRKPGQQLPLLMLQLMLPLRLAFFAY
jgi:hypothetical protein